LVFIPVYLRIVGVNAIDAIRHTQTHTHARTHMRTPVDEGSALRKDLILTTHNTHKTEVSIESIAPVNKQPMTDALNSAATRIGVDGLTIHKLQVSRFMCRYFR